jgi:hypothetical protein
VKATFILAPLLLASWSVAQEPFSFEALRVRARAMAMQPYQPPQTADLPRWLAELDFDGYRRIRFREETALWSADDLPFRVHFSHRGYLFPTRVPIHVVDGAKVAELMFHPDQFLYGFASPHGEVPPTLGYAGVTLLFRDGGAPAELASFRGASFFRLVGHGQHYGASARGLALDPESPEGEEHPAFAEMWVERPLPGARRLTLHALLDGRAFGSWLRRRGLLLAPAEVDPAPLVVRFRELLRTALPPSGSTPVPAIERVLHDASLRQLHLALSGDGPPHDALEWHTVEGAMLKYRLSGAASLSDAEQRQLLGSAAAIEALADTHSPERVRCAKGNPFAAADLAAAGVSWNTAGDELTTRGTGARTAPTTRAATTRSRTSTATSDPRPASCVRSAGPTNGSTLTDVRTGEARARAGIARRPPCDGGRLTPPAGSAAGRARGTTSP